MSYKLKCDEPSYVVTTFNEEMEIVNENNKGSEGLEMCEKYYWITHTDREDVLAIDSFMEAEKIMLKLMSEDEEINSFEDAEKQFEHTAQIQNDRPPY